MKKISKVLAIVLSLVMMVTVAPVSNYTVTTQAAVSVFEITSPAKGKLVAAGYFDIEWTEATKGTVQEYQVYVDNKLVGTTKETEYEYYATNVELYQVYIVAKYSTGETEKTATSWFYITKKGLAANDVMGRYLDPVEMNMGWYYSWGQSPFSYTTYNKIEFVPMIWGNGNTNDIPQVASKGFKYLLAYNEPDINHSGGSGIDVNTVINNWNKFLGYDYHLGSPAPAYSPSWDNGEWFRTFMNNVDHDSMDFIALHCYYGTYGGAAGANSFLKDVVDKTYEMYGKPIWVTEFAVSGWGYSNEWAKESLKEFMTTVIDGLNSRPYVERYSWFSFNTDDENNGASALWTNATGKLTELGEIYVNYGNPIGYDSSKVVEPYSPVTVEQGVRNTVLDDSVAIKNVVCEDYINADGVSVTASSEIGGNVAANAIDGSLGTRWESTQKVDPQYLTIDLGTPRNIKQVSIVWEDASASNYTVEVSNDGVNFETVATITGAAGGDNRNDTIVLKEMVNAQYVKIYGTARTSPYGYSIRDIAIYGTTDTSVNEERVVDSSENEVIPEKIPYEVPGETVDEKPKDNDSNNKITLKRIKNAKGYQVKVSTTKKFKKKKTVTKKVKKIKFTIKSKKIKGAKKLYIKARAYNGKTYGKWSKVKKIKVKK